MSRRSILMIIFGLIVLLGMPTQFGAFISKQTWIFFCSLKKGSPDQVSEISNTSLDTYLNQIQQEKESFTEEQSHYAKTSFCIANVIYHPRSTWHHSLWINQGKETQGSLFPITKNCPVVVGDVAVGVIEYVASSSSQVRLISDQNLHPSVRVLREHPDTSNLAVSILNIQKILSKNNSLMPKPELATTLSKLLDCLYSSIPSTTTERLAKGELQGALSSQTPNLLKGVGFNYEFDDEEGDHRDLRTGQTHDDTQKKALLLPGDILETTGHDGVFPKGLKIARVLEVFPLEEGAISYQITAESLAPSFPDLEYVSILPAQSQNIPSIPTTADQIQTLLSEENSCSYIP